MTPDPRASEPLPPALRAKIRRLAAPTAPEPGQDAGELNIIPYLDILMNVMMFVLATVAIVFVSSIDATAATINPNTTREPASALQLAVLVTKSGLSLKTAAGNVAPGCGSVGVGVTIPVTSAGYDLGSLTACARKLKAARPEFTTEDQVTVTASPEVAYAEIVATIDALRGDAEGPLFPKVAFGVVR